MEWLGSILLAGCGIPQAWHCARTQSAEGLSWSFVLAWFFGEVLTLAYVVDLQSVPLILNYSVNILCLLVILRYKIKELGT